MRTIQSEQASGRESLRQLMRLALAEFPASAQQTQIDAYIKELSQLMDPVATEHSSAEHERAQATSDATGDDEVTLLYKLESYLESVLVGRMASSGRRS